jgi:hypothetical protein
MIYKLKTGFHILIFLFSFEFVSCQRDLNISKQELTQAFELKLKKDFDVKKSMELENLMLYRTVYTNYYNYDNLDESIIQKNADRIDNGEAVKVYTEAGMKNAEEYWNDLVEFKNIHLRVKERYKDYFQTLGEREAGLLVAKIGRLVASNNLDNLPIDYDRHIQLKNKLKR